MNRIVLYISSGLIIILITALLYFNFMLNDKPFQKELIINIEKGESTSQIIKKFNEYGYLEPDILFYFYIGFLKLKDNVFIQAGIYKFLPNMNNYEIINSLINGKNLYTIKVTLPEGLRLNEYAKIIQDKIGINQLDFINLCKSKKIIDKFNIPADNLEGYLFPSTYFFPANISTENLIVKLLNEHLKIWNQDFEYQTRLLGMNKHEILTLASIIEAETPVDDEKSIVSRLYHNRLRKNMLLQADPTVQYALNTREPLKTSDLKYNSIYNTYIYKGLPPTPINNPSLSSIIAALYPIEHNYYYMVAIGDGSGRHYFSQTYSEHLINVKKYKKNLVIYNSNR
jgi:UPF0755 protein